MKVGDYVRTKGGLIGTVEEIEGTYKRYFIPNRKENDVIDIIKSSPNIIDLIEVGDYVNGYYVEDIRERYDDRIIRTLECATGSNYFQAPMYEEDIKSVVTKKQFESMEYRIGEWLYGTMDKKSR